MTWKVAAAVLFCNIGSKKKFPQISHNVGTNFKLQVVKQSEDAEDEAVAVFQPKGPAPATIDFYARQKWRAFFFT